MGRYFFAMPITLNHRPDTPCRAKRGGRARWAECTGLGAERAGDPCSYAPKLILTIWSRGMQVCVLAFCSGSFGERRVFTPKWGKFAG